nr:hypothetical protein [uncultured Cupriavidus sp.]
MAESVRWASECYRGMFVHALAFKLARDGATSIPGPKWGYLFGVGRIHFPSAELEFGGCETDQSDYFTREAAEHAALHYGRRVIDVMREFE